MLPVLSVGYYIQQSLNGSNMTGSDEIHCIHVYIKLLSKMLIYSLRIITIQSNSVKLNYFNVITNVELFQCNHKLA